MKRHINSIQHKYTLNKSNTAISISNNLTSIEKKFFNHILYIAQLNLNTLIYKVSAKDFGILIGNPNNRQTHAKIVKVFYRMMSKILEVISPTDTEFEATPYLAGAKLKDGIIEFQLSEIFKNFICIDINKNAKRYTQLDLSRLNCLSSTHSIALCENILSKTFAKKEVTFDVETLTKLICKETKFYKNFAQFNFNVLKKSIEEINKKMDMKISCELIKGIDNKTVEKVKFIVINTDDISLSNKKEVNQELDNNVTNDKNNYPQEISSIVAIGIKPAQKLLDWYQEDKNRLLANWHEISTKYADKNNAEKAKLMAYLWKVKANYISPEEIQTKEKELAEKIIKEAEIKQIHIEKKNQEENNKSQKITIRQNNREIFENEVAEENSQLSQIWKAVTKAIELNIPIQQVKTWFNPAIAKIEDNTLNIVLPNRFKLDFFKNNLLRYVNEALHNINVNMNVKVSL